jgi:hypothetical protein
MPSPAGAAGVDANSGLMFVDDGTQVTITGITSETNGKSLAIPSTINGDPVTTIYASAFGGWARPGPTSINVPASVTRIEGGAFANSLASSLTFDPGIQLQYVGSSAFSSMTNLTALVLPLMSSTYVAQNVAEYERSLQSVTITGDPTTVPGWMFDGAGSLTSVTLPDSIYYIGPYAFSNDGSLTTFTSPQVCSRSVVAYSKMTPHSPV